MTDWKNELHSKALVAARNFKEAEKDLQGSLREIDQHKIYYELGYRSLMDYAISALGLTPDVAYNHCSVVKKSQTLPEVRKALSQGVVSVSAVRHMAPVLTQENQQEMLELASKLTQTELRREVAKRNPEMAEVAEKARYVREDRLALELRVSEELMQKLRRAQDLVSQSHRTLATLEETLEAMAEAFLDKKDPLRKAERSQEKSKLPLPEPRIIRRPAQGRSVISTAMKSQLLLRAQGQCSAKNPNGKPCLQNRWLHFHHIRPLREGGAHSLDNLTVLCAGHHRMIHRNMNQAQPRASG